MNDRLETPDRLSLVERFNSVERLVKRGILDRPTALKLIRIELRKTLSDPDRAFLIALGCVLARE